MSGAKLHIGKVVRMVWKYVSKVVIPCSDLFELLGIRTLGRIISEENVVVAASCRRVGLTLSLWRGQSEVDKACCTNRSSV